MLLLLPFRPRPVASHFSVIGQPREPGWKELSKHFLGSPALRLYFCFGPAVPYTSYITCNSILPFAGATSEGRNSQANAAADDCMQAMQAVVAAEACGNVPRPHERRIIAQLPLAVPNSGFLCHCYMF